MKNKKAIIKYFTLTDEMRKNEKLDWFRENRLKDIPFETIKPDKNNNWINLTDNDFDELLPIANKETKLSKKKNDEKAVFKLFSLGVVTNRDEWVYDFNKENLEKKVQFFCDFYENEKIRWNKSSNKIAINDFVDRTIKWTSELEAHLQKSSILQYCVKNIWETNYRPFCKLWVYYDRIIIHRIYQNDLIFGINKQLKNKVFGYIGMNTAKPFSVLGTNVLSGLNFLSPASGSQMFALYRYDKSGNRIENITDWGLKQFTEHYANVQTLQENVQTLHATSQRNVQQITKEDIFHYTYGVLHNPAYRKKYELNLKREFPRLPFYKDFYKWVNWGKELMDLHINYETIEPYSTVQTLQGNVQTLHATSQPATSQPATSQPATSQPATSQQTPKAKLKRNKETNEIILDENTSIKGIPKIAFDYKLGNRSAIDWILDQYKEKKPRDKTIAEKFNTYKFADYKETVIDLIRRVTTVSVKTMEIVNKMEAEELHNDKEKRNKKT